MISQDRQYKRQLGDMGIGFPQDEAEFFGLVQSVSESKPQTFVEIGTRDGGSLWMVAQFLPIGATIVSIDLPGEAWGKKSSGSKKERVAQLLKEQGFNVHLIEMDSQQLETVQALREVLGERDIDLLFLNGDHRWKGILADWTLYHSLVGTGGMVAFRDINHSCSTPRVKVWVLWDVLKTIYPHQEFVAQIESSFGIGVLWK